MKKPLTYAEVAETLSKREGKYESLLKEASSTGDVFQKNSAELMLDRVRRYRDELFAEQEATKAPEMGMGGKTKYAFGGPPYKEPHFLENPFEDPSSAAVPAPFRAKQPGSVFSGQPSSTAPTLQRFVPDLGGPKPERMYAPAPRTSSVTSAGSSAVKAPSLGYVEKAGALSLASMFMANRAASNMQRPVAPRSVAPPRLNTRVDVSDQLNDIDQGTLALERSVVRTGLPGANAVSLGRRTSADRLKAGVYAARRNQEASLENQQATMTYQTDLFNTTQQNQYQEAGRQFENDRMAFRQRASAEAITGIQSAMRDKQMMDLDLEKSRILGAGYASPVRAELIRADIEKNPTASDLMRKYSLRQIEQFGATIQNEDPALYERLKQIFPQIFN
jgi:hypothetical protein